MNFALLGVICILVFLLTRHLVAQNTPPKESSVKAVPLSWKELQESAQKGDADAMYQLGQLSRKGSGDVEKNIDQAMKWYRLAAAKADARAQFQIGLYYSGTGVPQDSIEALKWYHLAAEAGNSDAQYNLGVMYDEQRGRRKHPFLKMKEAIKWYEKAAQQGNSAAAYNLALIYRHGKQEILKDINKAIEWYKRAVELKDAAAANNLASLYYNGKEIEEDEQEALKWFLKAAEGGYTTAYLNLGKLYVQGEKANLLNKLGVNPKKVVLEDRVEAYKWLFLALERAEHTSLEDSEDDTEIFKKKISDFIAKHHFTTQEQTKGKERAKEYLQKKHNL